VEETNLEWVVDVDAKINIKMVFRETGCDSVNWIELAQGMIQRRTFVKTVMNIRVQVQQEVCWPAEYLFTFQRRPRTKVRQLLSWL
jgi:metal-sulfur cluster biosynthetic enzyme